MADIEAVFDNCLATTTPLWSPEMDADTSDDWAGGAALIGAAVVSSPPRTPLSPSPSVHSAPSPVQTSTLGKHCLEPASPTSADPLTSIKKRVFKSKKKRGRRPKSAVTPEEMDLSHLTAKERQAKKRKVRREQNRRAAKNSRERRKLYVQELEQKVKDLDAENKQLRELQSVVSQLKREKCSLQRRLEAALASSSASVTSSSSCAPEQVDHSWSLVAPINSITSTSSPSLSSSSSSSKHVADLRVSSIDPAVVNRNSSLPSKQDTRMRRRNACNKGKTTSNSNPTFPISQLGTSSQTAMLVTIQLVNLMTLCLCTMAKPWSTTSSINSPSQTTITTATRSQPCPGRRQTSRLWSTINGERAQVHTIGPFQLLDPPLVGAQKAKLSITGPQAPEWKVRQWRPSDTPFSLADASCAT